MYDRDLKTVMDITDNFHLGAFLSTETTFSNGNLLRTDKKQPLNLLGVQYRDLSEINKVKIKVLPYLTPRLQK